MGCQVGRFVVGFPAVMVDKGETIYDADPNLCSEFNLGLGLAAYNRTDVWLMYADYTVITRMCAKTEHLFLLVIHVNDGLYGALLRTVESTVCPVVHPYEIEKGEYVSVKQRKHAGERVFNQFRTFVLALDYLEIDLPYAVALHSGRFAYLLYSAYLVYHSVNVFRAILNKIYVRRVSDFGIRACGICLHISRLSLLLRSVVHALAIPVPVLLLVPVFFLFHLPGFPCKFKSKGIYVLYCDSFADGREQRRVKYRLVGILGQSAHILHVWIFLYRQYCLLIGKVKLMLYDEGCDDHAPRTVGRPDTVILQSLVINLLIFRPWKCVAHLHPPVGFRQTFKRTLHLFEGHLAVQGYDFHVGWSSFNTKVSSFLLKKQTFEQLNYMLYSILSIIQ